MTGIIHTVNMSICWFTTLVTLGNDFISDPFTKSLIKDEILPMKFITQVFLPYLVSIVDNPALQVKYILKSFMKHIRRRFFTTDTTCAIHDDVCIFLILHHI